MKVALIYNKVEKGKDPIGVINVFGMKNKERYNPKTVEKVAKALENGGHVVKIIEGNMEVIDELKEFMPKVISGEKHGMVFNMAYGIQGQSRYTHIPAMLEMLGIPYVGSDPSAHALALDKVIAKFIFVSNNIPTPGFWVFNSVDEIPDDLPYPLITKPKMEAVSYGIKIVNNKEELVEGIKFIIDEFKQQVLVEQFISGREFAIGILGNRDPEIFPIVEFDFKGNPDAIQSVGEKLSKPVEKVCPAELRPDLEEKMKKITLDAFRSLNLSDFARVDIRMDDKENIYILEINSMASLGGTGSYVKAATTAGYTYDTLVNKMLEVATYRYFGHEFKLLEEDTPKTGKKTKVGFSAKVRSYLRSQSSILEDYLEEITEINTNTYNSEEITKIDLWINKKLSNLGFNREVISLIDINNILYFRNHFEENNEVLFLCNLDYVYNYDDFSSFKIDKNKIYGSGVSYNKGGIVTLFGALKALKFNRKLKNTKIGIIFISDSSIGCKYSKDTLKNLAQTSKRVIALSGGGKEGGIITSTSGSTKYIIEFISTKEEHDKVIKNLIPVVTSKLNSLLKLPTIIENTDILFNSIEIYQNPGRKNKIAKLDFNISYKFPELFSEISDQIDKIVKSKRKDNLRVNITKQFNRPPYVDNESNKIFFKEVQAIAKTLEIKTQPFHKNNFSYIGFISEKPVLDGLGPIGGNYPSSEEYIIRESLIDRAALIASLINKISKKQK